MSPITCRRVRERSLAGRAAYRKSWFVVGLVCAGHSLCRRFEACSIGAGPQTHEGATRSTGREGRRVEEHFGAVKDCYTGLLHGVVDLPHAFASLQGY